jgi:RNA-directed DNA polymerase
MEEVVDAANLRRALKRVRSNKGSPGVDGMTTKELPAYLKGAWPRLQEELLAGTYRPQPVKRAEIPKPGGGVRALGIPTVVDRFIQQVLTPVVRPDVLAVELRDPTRQERPSGAGGGAGARREREGLGSGRRY